MILNDSKTVEMNSYKLKQVNKLDSKACTVSKAGIEPCAQHTLCVITQFD